MSEIVIAVYAQQTGQAGRICYDEAMIERESEDLNIYRAKDAGDMREWIESIRRNHPGNNSNDLYWQKVADSLEAELASITGEAADEMRRGEDEAAAMEAERQRVERESLPSRYPYLEQMDGSTKRPTSLAAANIRKELKRRWPGIKFAVRCSSGSGGSINVSWQDGPRSAAVERITSKYSYGHFDGMIDSYEYKADRVWTGLFGGSKYICCQRSYTDAEWNAVVATLGYDPDSMDWRDKEHVYRVLRDRFYVEDED